MSAHTPEGIAEMMQRMLGMLETLTGAEDPAAPPAGARTKVDLDPTTDTPPIDAASRKTPGSYGYANVANRFYKERYARLKFFDEGLLGEPAWDILLDLFRHTNSGKQISITSACIASNVAPTTALRWINILVERGLVLRVGDPVDRRRAFLQLTKPALVRIDEYFKAIDN